MTGYTVKDSDGNTFNISGTSFTQSVPYVPNSPYLLDGYPTVFKTYQIQAHYAGGNSAWSAPVSLQPSTVWGSIIPATGGGNALAVSGIPTNAVAVRVFMYYVGTYIANNQEYDFVVTTNVDIPVGNFVNGICPAPASWLNLAQMPSYPQASWWDYSFYLQSVDASGNVSGGSFLFDGLEQSWLWGPDAFYDGRVQLKQNLIFQLRESCRYTEPSYLRPETEYSCS